MGLLDGSVLPDNRLLGAADYAGVQPGYAPPGLLNAGPIHDAASAFAANMVNTSRAYLQQHQDFLDGIDPNTGQPAVTPYDRFNTLAHFFVNNMGPQSIGGVVAPVKGAFGAGAIRGGTHALDMSEAARMQRAADLGYRPGTLYNAQRGATDAAALPTEYPNGVWLTRDRDYAAGIDKTGAGPREFMTNPGRTFASQGTLNLKDYADIVSAVEKRYGAEGAQPLINQIAPGKTPEWLRGMATKNPDMVVSDAPALHVFQPLVKMTGNEPEAGAVLRDAGFRSVDAGTHLWNLDGEGVRLKSAAFNPADADSLNITKALLPAAVAGSGLLGGASSQ